MTLDEDGDMFERWQCEWIRQTFQPYEEWWCELIGNDGKCNSMPIDGIDEASNITRMKVHQSLYTALVCCYYIDECYKSIEKDCSCVNGPEQYFCACRRLQDYMCYVGTVCDMFGRIDSELNGKKCARDQSFHDFFEARNKILHGYKIPLKIEEDILLIPNIYNRNCNDAWDDKSLWINASICKSEYYVDLCKRIKVDLFNLVNKQIQRVKSGMYEKFHKRTIDNSSVGLLCQDAKVPNAERGPIYPSGQNGI